MAATIEMTHSSAHMKIAFEIMRTNKSEPRWRVICTSTDRLHRTKRVWYLVRRKGHTSCPIKMKCVLSLHISIPIDARPDATASETKARENQRQNMNERRLFGCLVTRMKYAYSTPASK